MLRRLPGNKSRRIAGPAALLVAVGVATFVLVRGHTPGSLVSADPNHNGPASDATAPLVRADPEVIEPPTDATAPVGPDEEWNPAVPTGGVGELNPPGDDVTPEPGATPDITQSWWHIPYVNAERDEPVTVKVINGITVGPGLDQVRDTCDVETRRGDPSEATDPALHPEMAIVIDVVPGMRIEEARPPTICRDVVMATGVDVRFEDEEAFPFGGRATIVKFRGEPIVRYGIPDNRWRATTIGGFPAAVAEPLVPGVGVGLSAAIVVTDEYVLRIQASNVSVPMLMQLVEGQLR